MWLAPGWSLHDLVLTPWCWLIAAARRSRCCRPRPGRPAAVGLVVLGSVTLLAVPVLGRFGARADNPTLLDRDYLAGWLVRRLVVPRCVVAVDRACVRSRDRRSDVARVLVVDDDPTVREVVVSYLRAAGHDVVEAADGEAALAAMRDAAAPTWSCST